MRPNTTFTLLLPLIASTVNGFRFNIPTRIISKCFSTEIDSSAVDNVPDKSSVYIGNLPLDADESELKSFFEEKVGSSFSNLRIPLERTSGLPRGFAYLDFDDKPSAESAIAALAGSSCRERLIKVDMADRERPPREKREFSPPENSVYVGNLDFDVTEEELSSLCETVLGEGKIVKVRIAFDRATQRARGFAHIDFTDAETATRAVTELNSAVIRDREIRVDFAQRKDARGPRPSSSPRSFNDQQHSVFIGNLAWDMTGELIEEMINDVLGPGLFKKVRLAQERETGRSRGFGHVDFKDEASADRAIAELNGLEVLGRTLRVDHAQRKSDSAGSNRSFNPRRGDGPGRYDSSENNSGDYGSW
mmetsp:Transcript_25346/g.25573  ORF Transcript_25346/g.25573 Transcript_25346/m.25573 type:complete len:363 (-) Transcript_25346:180-1268(-)|eukprot:CAMPEP_0182416788 /NCGR_PEP_ID=MMETSP1167-20130531/1137_1 /TAXON_ID=2988 /ORGANISM="Mallomonas Sp, Strain CCMP3275" /LENGTH=362 /DNA_ID=CAMNT_0024589855 /DNA_START=178 /DNA_END=1266 /DNA_ORIENTATION=+